MTNIDRLPTFLVIGAMKGGTTALHSLLDRHPRVFMSKPKELNFFVEEKNWQRGFAWYESHFADASVALARGESSTSYTKFPRYSGVPERIARVLPSAKLVYVVRDPVSRIESHYGHVARHQTLGPIDQVVTQDPRYVDCTRYVTQLRRYLDHFPADQLLVIVSERLRDQGAHELSRVFTHIGVSDVAVSAEGARTNRSVDHPPLRAGRLRRSAVGRGVAAVVPARARRAVSPLLRKPPVDARLSPAIAAYVRAQLAEEMSELRTLIDDPIPEWPDE